MKPRNLFDQEVLREIEALFAESWELGRDFSFQASREEAFCSEFSQFMGGGFSDAVCSGSVAVFLCLQALGLPKGSEVIVSPVTDPGGISAVIQAGLTPIVADAAPGQWNTSAEEIAKVLSPKCAAALLTHSGGSPLDLDPITQLLDTHNVALIEDASQATGALYKGRPVGSFGRLAAFSTMFSKTLASGGCGGLVFTKEEALYWKLRSLADRGKPFQDPLFNPKDPHSFLFPALNYNADEIQCTIGSVILRRLPKIIEARQQWMAQLLEKVRSLSSFRLLQPVEGGSASPFFLSLELAPGVDKASFAAVLRRHGIAINADYRYVVSEWPWVQAFLGRPASTPNALSFRNRSINILFHERFGACELAQTSAALFEADQVSKPYLEGDSDAKRREVDSEVSSCHL